jgi:uncharacterized peroxidase-related enzyme
MTWIKFIPYHQATSRLKTIYNRVKGRDGQIDNILSAHSLRPHTLEGHMSLYKNVLHHSGNTLPKWLLEVLGVYVSALNNCDYCVHHHLVGMRTAVGDPARADAMEAALKSGNFDGAFDARAAALLHYVEQLTRAPETLRESDMDPMRRAGLDDGEILEANQVIAYFAYANRMVLGLGITTEGEQHIGLSPKQSDQPNNWEHS